MEELKLIAEIVGGLSTTALYAFLVWMLYKFTWIAASVYTLCFIVAKVHDWMVKGKIKTWDLDGISIDESVAQGLKQQILRLRSPNGLRYLHSSAVFALRSAIDKYLEEKGK